MTVAHNGRASFNVVTNDSDPDGDRIWIGDYDDVPTVSGNVTCDVAGGCEFVAARGYSGTVTFDYVLTDGAANATATVTVTVQPPANAAPVANDDSALVQDRGSATIDVLGNDSDPDGDALTVRIVGGPSSGSAVVTADQRITYTYNAGARSAADQVTYEVSDPTGATDTAVLRLDVNHAPTATGDAVSRTNQDQSRPFNPVTGAGTNSGTRDSDPDGDSLTFGGVVSGPATGTVACDAAGECTYDPPGICDVLTTSFTYRVRDGRGGSSTARVDISYDGASC